MSIQLIPARGMKLLDSRVGTKLVPMINGTYWGTFWCWKWTAGEFGWGNMPHLSQENANIRWEYHLQQYQQWHIHIWSTLDFRPAVIFGSLWAFFCDELSLVRLVREMVTFFPWISQRRCWIMLIPFLADLVPNV